MAGLPASTGPAALGGLRQQQQPPTMPAATGGPAGIVEISAAAMALALLGSAAPVVAELPTSAPRLPAAKHKRIHKDNEDENIADHG